MPLCRICFDSASRLSSFFESRNGISYATMITTIADVKIWEYSSDMICITCKEKLEDFYEFKKLIERSNLKIKEKFGKLKTNKSNESSNTIKKYCSIDNGSRISLNELNVITYNDLIIKKVVGKKEEKMNHVLEKNKVDMDHCDLVDVNKQKIKNAEDKDAKDKIKHKFKYRLKNKQTGSDQKKTKVRLKPVYLDDIRIVSSKSKGKIQTEIDNRRRRKHPCQYCGILIADVKKHILTHTAERNHKCTECNRRFYERCQLDKHAETHALSAAYRCHHCVATFTTKASIVTHMSIHQSTRQFVCKSCNKSFKWRSGLRRHSLSHAARSVRCGACDMTFLTRANLRDHARVHTGERPYNCEICSQPYSYKRDFNKHCLKKHGIFLKRRSIHVLNDEVLRREKQLMEEVSRALVDGQPPSPSVNPFRGPQAAQAFKLALEQLQAKTLADLLH